MSLPLSVRVGGLRSSSEAGGVLLLMLNNTLEAVEDGRLRILQHLAPLNLDPRVINRLEVVWEEVISNIVRHGFAPGKDQTIRAEVSASPGAIDLTIEDDGAAFNPLDATVAKPRSLEEAGLGGLGIPLVKKLSTAVRYEAPGPGARRAESDFAPNNRLTVSIAR